MQADTTTLETLPGAERFFEYLKGLFPGQTLIIEGPEVLDRSYGIEYAKQYRIMNGQETVGTYKTFGPKPGETDFAREFEGVLPGHVNAAIVILNKHRGDADRKLPEGTVALCFSNKKFEAGYFHEGPGKMVETPWQRQDGHVAITEFP